MKTEQTNRSLLAARLRAPALAVLAALAGIALLTGCGESGGCEGADCASGGADLFDGRRALGDVERQVAFGPRPSGSAANERQVRYLARSLQLAGARDVTIQRPWRNVVATIPGEGEGTVLIGAHHDTKDDIPGFVGANDGGSGVAVVLELARALAGEPGRDGPTVEIALFDAEEARGDSDFERDGTRGSRQYVEYAEEGVQGSAPLEGEGAIDEMILFDMVGDCDLSIPREENSDPELYEAIEAEAAELSGERSPFGGETDSVLDDHIPFLEAGVPAVDLIDFTYGGDETPGEFWHTPRDTLDKVCAESLDAVGEPVLRYLGGGAGNSGRSG